MFSEEESSINRKALLITPLILVVALVLVATPVVAQPDIVLGESSMQARGRLYLRLRDGSWIRLRATWKWYGSKYGEDMELSFCGRIFSFPIQPPYGIALSMMVTEHYMKLRSVISWRRMRLTALVYGNREALDHPPLTEQGQWETWLPRVVAWGYINGLRFHFCGRPVQYEELWVED